MLDDWARKASERFQKTNGFGHSVMYVSYAHGGEAQEMLYGNNLEKLQTLKKQWDPKGAFNFNAAIKV